jgi:excisionase family DNA binding protein
MDIPDAAAQPTITVDELGELLGVSRSTAYESVRNGDVPSIRLGRRIVVPTAAVRRMLLLDGDGRPAA